MHGTQLGRCIDPDPTPAPDSARGANQQISGQLELEGVGTGTPEV
jgi:hypothetical protein